LELGIEWDSPPAKDALLGGFSGSIFGRNFGVDIGNSWPTTGSVATIRSAAVQSSMTLGSSSSSFHVSAISAPAT
jgi:hypothetical protein